METVHGTPVDEHQNKRSTRNQLSHLLLLCDLEHFILVIKMINK
jgi:hypothetical protein